MSAIKDIKRKCVREMAEMREVIRSMEEHVHSGQLYHLMMVSTFFDTLRYHLKDGDLRPENIDLILNLKQKELEND